MNKKDRNTLETFFEIHRITNDLRKKNQPLYLKELDIHLDVKTHGIVIPAVLIAFSSFEHVQKPHQTDLSALSVNRERIGKSLPIYQEIHDTRKTILTFIGDDWQNAYRQYRSREPVLYALLDKNRDSRFRIVRGDQNILNYGIHLSTGGPMTMMVRRGHLSIFKDGLSERQFVFIYDLSALLFILEASEDLNIKEFLLIRLLSSMNNGYEPYLFDHMDSVLVRTMIEYMLNNKETFNSPPHGIARVFEEIAREGLLERMRDLPFETAMMLMEN